jgi:hypothetical protein
MEHDLVRLCHAYQHRNLRKYELCKSEFLTQKFYTSIKPLILVRKAKNAKYMAEVSLIAGGS